jgi:hypothetical protein
LIVATLATMSPFVIPALTALVFVAILGGMAGILLERQRAPAQPGWRNPAVRDALLPIAGWASLFMLDRAVALIGAHNLPVRPKHLLGTLAVLLLYYALLATLRLIYCSARRVAARLGGDRQPYQPRAVPLLGRLRFPTLFMSAALAALSVLYYDGLTLNLAFMAAIVAVLGFVHRTQEAPSAAQQ